MWGKWITFQSLLVAGQKATSLLNLEICFTVTFTMTYFPVSSLLTGWSFSPNQLFFLLWFLLQYIQEAVPINWVINIMLCVTCHLVNAMKFECFLEGDKFCHISVSILSWTQCQYHLVCRCKECLLISHVLEKSKGMGTTDVFITRISHNLNIYPII